MSNVEDKIVIINQVTKSDFNPKDVLELLEGNRLSDADVRSLLKTACESNISLQESNESLKGQVEDLTTAVEAITMGDTDLLDELMS